MPRVLLLPTRVDAIRLAAGLSGVGPRVDFTQIPYWNGAREVNPDVANVSDDLVCHPFQDRGFFLPAGTHLHWALPGALTRAVSSDEAGGIVFPAVPNRWLVTRSRGASDASARIEKRWIVESDYVFPEDEEEPPGTVALPFPGRRRPFAFVGRQRPFAANWTEPPAAHHLAGLGYRLTAVGYEAVMPVPDGARGYSEPTFAAFFPHCYSVFGCHDPDPPADWQGVRYEVIGWYSKPEWDPLKAEVFSAALARSNAETPRGDDAQVLRRALLAAYDWKLDDKPYGALERTIVYARIEIASGDAVCAPLSDRPVQVAVGNTATEALSALLAQQLAAPLGTTPGRLEEQLEALHLATRLEGISVRDLGPKFDEARHDRGFSRVAGGSSWTVRWTNPGAREPEPSDIHARAPLPDQAATALDALNAVERAYGRALAQLRTMQRQLFADWYKYMLCSYPPADSVGDYPPLDEVRFFIETYDLPRIHRQHALAVALGRERNEAKSALARLLSAVSSSSGDRVELLERPGPRYYRPHEPVLVIAGDGLRPTERYAPGEALHCHVLEIDEGGVEGLAARVRQALDKLAPTKERTRGFSLWNGQPWQPFILEWSVEVSPLKRANNLEPSSRRYSEDFIETNFQLSQDGVELTPLDRAGEVERAASIYAGSSILTPHAKFQLIECIQAYLAKCLLKPFFEAHSTPLAERVSDYIERHRDAVVAWYQGQTKLQDPVLDTVLEVLKHVDRDGFHGLGQALNGFNDALLMRRQTFQLRIAEPFGFDDGRRFTETVRKAVGNHARSAPQPLDDFHPIRTGQLRILALRLVDTFGRAQHLTLAGDRIIRTEVFTQPEQSNVVALPPRLVQPARLNFRWLSASSAGSHAKEMTSHTTPSAILGWFIPNHLDNSLMVYGPGGDALGSLVQTGRWEPAPGATPGAQLADIEGQLGSLVRHVHAAGKAALVDFLADVDHALQNVEPKGFAEHDALALLIGRPVAVVRATLSLELQGEPAINQSWAAFGRDLARALWQTDGGRDASGAPIRERDGITGVRFPVLLGDAAQHNDGLVGMWQETVQGYGEFKSGGDCRVSVTPDGAATLLTMLIDPRAPVHARTGILPIKAIDLPPEQYARALKSIGVTFLTAPLLSPVSSVRSSVELSLPGEPGYAWSWLSPHDEPIEPVPANPLASWGRPVEILEGWLKLAKDPD